MLPDPENMGKAVGISLLSWLTAEIYVISYLLPVLSRHIGYLWVLHLFCFRHLVALPYLGKVTKAFPLTSSGYEMAAKIVARGFVPPPRSRYEGYYLWPIWLYSVKSSMLVVQWKPLPDNVHHLEIWQSQIMFVEAHAVWLNRMQELYVANITLPLTINPRVVFNQNCPVRK